MPMNRFLLALFAFVSATVGLAQASTLPVDSLNPQIVVKGTVRDQSGIARGNILIINQRINAGTFGNANGTFTVYAHKFDTLVIGAFGFHSEKLCFRDSTLRRTYAVDLRLRPLTIEIAEVEVFSPRDLEDIASDIQQLGYDERDYRESGVDAYSSPITFLYQQFSRRERSRRKAIELTNNDRRRELLKELFAKYVAFDIIDLPSEEFDTFIDFIRVDDAFLKRISQYEFILFVKKRYDDYRVLYRQQPLDPGDFQYHEDEEPVPPPAGQNRGN